jgi:hypothetical protein
LFSEAGGWNQPCGNLGSGGGAVHAAIGFALQHDRRGDDSVVVLRASPDYRQVLGARCRGGSWQPLGVVDEGVVAEVDNITRVLRQLVLVAERGGRGPVALVAIDEGYSGATSYLQATLGDTGFEAGQGLERARYARSGALGAAAIGAGAIGFVQGFEAAGAVELEAWRYRP